MKILAIQSFEKVNCRDNPRIVSVPGCTHLFVISVERDELKKLGLNTEYFFEAPWVPTDAVGRIQINRGLFEKWWNAFLTSKKISPSLAELVYIGPDSPLD